jgi:hypothetical protein
VAKINSKDNWISRKWFIPLLMAFFIPLAVRIIPEVLMGPYLVGFDTVGYYVPNTLLWLQGGLHLGSFLATAPLFYILYMPLVAIGGSPVYILKVIAPLLLGFLGLAIYSYAKKGLAWSSPKSLFVALLGTLYFVALRTSWDQLREELGLIFFFVALMLILPNLKDKSWKNYLVLSLAMLTVVLSHQLVAVLLFGVITVTILYTLRRKQVNQSINLIVTSLPAALYFVIVYLSGILQSNIFGYSNEVSPLTGFTSYQLMLVNPYCHWRL